MNSERCLDGLRVVDLADEKGELCGRILADFGADVIRIEPPEGAGSRALSPRVGEKSLYFAYRNFNKRGAVLDLKSAEGCARLHKLLAGADIMIESERPGALAALGLDPAVLIEQHPHLIVTSISDFGQSGPYRDWAATDMVMEALGGMMFKAGLPEKEPLSPPGAVAYDIAGIVAAYATLLACYQRMGTGAGQHIDLSVMEAVAQTTDWSFPNASITRQHGAEPNELRQGSGPIYSIYPCKDGFVRLVILSPRQWRAMRAWLGEPEGLQEDHWDSFLARLGISDVLLPLYTEHLEQMTMVEASVEAQRRGIACTPVLRPEQVIENEHLRSRGTFVDVELAKGVSGAVAAGFFEIDGERQGFQRRAPEQGEHTEAVLAETGSRPEPSSTAPVPTPPLQGLRVLDFGIGGVGVEGSRLLAEYGADVIKIETRSYPDFIRVIMNTEMSPSFASSSRSKRGFGLNAKSEQGLAVLHKLIEQADVIVENGSTGTMDAMGVGYEAVRRMNPRVVMVSSQLLGSRGVWADWIGYGPSTQPLGGMVHLWNYADQDDPAGGLAIFPDHLAGRLCAIAAVAALVRRGRTNSGAHAEVAQVEAVTGVLGDLLCKASIDPGSVAPTGNRRDRGAPWGVYACAGEQEWCVITVRDDAEWAGLCRALGNPEWTRDRALADAAGRMAAADAIDVELGKWTGGLDKREVAARLQAEGVPAGPMLTGCGQLDDPHLAARGYPREVAQQDLGTITFEGPAFRASGMTDAITFQAPRLGEHTREICRELLGMDDAEVDRLIASGALEGPPPTD